MTDLSPIDLILRGMTDDELADHRTYMVAAQLNALSGAMPATSREHAFMQSSVDAAQAEINRRCALVDGWLPVVFMTTGGDIPNPKADFLGSDVEVTDHWPTPITVTDLRGDTHDVAARARAWPNT